MSALQDAAIQAAETIQTAHIRHKPTLEDRAPSTAADSKKTVQLAHSSHADEAASAVDEDEIPVSLLKPQPRRPQMPPLPDLRFEQSYLASIKDAKGWPGVTYITVRDQVFMPLVQGVAWTLIVAGWKHWNGTAKFSGRSVGARIRRWWWGVNNWDLPPDGTSSLSNRELAEGASEYYQNKANAGWD